MRNPLLVPDLRELIRAGEAAALGDFFNEHHPARVAEIIEDLEPDEGDAILGILPPRGRADVLSYLAGDRQIGYVEKMPAEDAATLLHMMSHDERADLVNRLDEEHVDRILPHLAQAERDDIRRLASYEPGTAGAVMTTDYVTLPPHIHVREALERLRHEAPDRETIYYSYVVDSARKLIGFVSLKKLILSRPQARIEDIMQRDVIFARVDEDQESAARQIDKYDFIALPVVDANDMLLGIITHDDAMDILRQEQTEDMLAFGGVSREAPGDEEPYWQGRLLEAVRRRIGWLLLLFLAGLITRFVSRSFDWVDKRFPYIDFDAFVPLLIGTGGNAGSQAVGTIIRALALGEIQPRDTLRVVARESLTGLSLGMILGPVGFLFTWGLLRHPPIFGVVMGLAILGICVWANAVGALVPLLAKKAGIDPALISAPLISTVVDATGLCVFYTVAIALLIKLAPAPPAQSPQGRITPEAVKLSSSSAAIWNLRPGSTGTGSVSLMLRQVQVRSSIVPSGLRLSTVASSSAVRIRTIHDDRGTQRVRNSSTRVASLTVTTASMRSTSRASGAGRGGGMIGLSRSRKHSGAVTAT